MVLPGPVDWAGVGDTYFAMVTVPAGKPEGLELRTTQYDYSGNGKPESRYLISAWVPVPTDGSRTVLYTGPKDHFLLTDASKNISQIVGRNIDLEGLIDYGWFSWMSRPLAVPILKSIKWLSQLTGSYGVAIILFTIVIYSAGRAATADEGRESPGGLSASPDSNAFSLRTLPGYHHLS